MNNNQNTVVKNDDYATVTRSSAGSRVIKSGIVGFAGMAVLPVLSILSITFTAVGAALPIISLLNLTGITHIPFNVGMFLITGFPQVIVALIAGLLFLLAGYGCFYGLRKFLAASRKFIG